MTCIDAGADEVQTIQWQTLKRIVWEASILGPKTGDGRRFASTHMVGDVHGQYLALLRLLQNAGFLEGLRWAGQNRRLWFIGDLFDRGPDGLAVANLVMRLQHEARSSGGEVGAILGNHEVMLLAAYHFGGLRPTATGQVPEADFLRLWQGAGGRMDDLVDLRADHVAWLTSLPVMTLMDNHLILHSDTTNYERYGSSIHEVNQAVRSVLEGRDRRAWFELIQHLGDRDSFLDAGGVARAAGLLRRYGGQRIVHGHTPISLVSKIRVTNALHYADGLCANIDGGFSNLEPGFVYRLEAVPEDATAPETA